MADGLWNLQQQNMLPTAGMLKRPRNDYDLTPAGQPSGHEMHGYLSRDDDSSGLRPIKDTQTIGSAYDRYLRSVQNPSSTSAEVGTLGEVGLGQGFPDGILNLPTTDNAFMNHPGELISDLARIGRTVSFVDQFQLDAPARPGRKVPLPADASSTLYVEGLPPDSSRREVAHIFRPFVGYKEVRLVSKESKHRGGDPLILCFVDFANPACAATALSALQGYRVDDTNPDSSNLRLQFSRFPGPRSGAGSRAKR